VSIAEILAQAESQPDRRQQIIDRVSAMPLEDQRVLAMRFEHGMKAVEIAAVLGWTPRQVMNSLARSLSALQEPLDTPLSEYVKLIPVRLNGEVVP